MKTTLFVFLLLSCLSSFGKGTPEKYFMLNDGSRQSFTQFDINGDTVFFKNNSLKNFLLVDSISGIHVYTPPGHGRGAGIAGFLLGGLFGGIIGIAIGSRVEFGVIYYLPIGFLVGGVVGSTVATSDHGKHAKNIDLDIKPYIKQEKIKILSMVLKDLK